MFDLLTGLRAGRRVRRNLRGGSVAVMPLTVAFLAAMPPSMAPPAGVRPDTVLADTYADPEVEALIRRAKAVRSRVDSSVRSLDVTFRERLYAGVSAERFRRERGLFHRERAARVRLERDGDRTVRWLGARSGTPFGEERVSLDESDFRFLRPDSDRLFLHGSWAVHPLADSAAAHYRYRSGDTLRVQIPALDRTVTLVEAIVEPREARFDLVAGSLWFDQETAQLVRAAYRPARRFELDDEDIEGAPASLLEPVTATVDYMTVDYALRELRWWLPDRMAFSGEATIAGSIRFPLRVEWSFGDWEVNAPSDLDPGEDLPDGWRRVVRRPDSESDSTADSEDEGAEPREPWVPGDSSRTVVVIPPPDSLARSPALPSPLGRGAADFETGELDALREGLGRIAVPPTGIPGPRLRWGARLLRYNRVEGPSAGARLTWPLRSRTDLRVTGRLGGDLEPNGELALIRRRGDGAGALRVAAYRRLAPVGDWGAPLGLGNSLGTLLLGRDDGLYYRTAGAEAAATWRGPSVRLEGRLFAERQTEAEKTTDFSLPDLVGENALPPGLEARPADLAGVSGRLRWQGGAGPTGAALSGTVWGEAAAGDADFARLATSAAVAFPLGFGLDGALEVGTGGTAGRPPPQRLWYVGGPYSLRGFRAGALAGEAFWLSRAELGLPIDVSDGQPRDGGGLRLTLFADAAWAGDRNAFGSGGPAVAVGTGISLLDGLLRVDLARGVRRGDDWRLHLYSDGLF